LGMRERSGGPKGRASEQRPQVNWPHQMSDTDRIEKINNELSEAIMTLGNLRDLYQQVILEHYKSHGTKENNAGASVSKGHLLGRTRLS